MRHNHKELKKVLKLSAFGVVGLMLSTNSMANTIGSDFNLKMTPTAAAMGGVGYTAPQDAVASVFGNPATLTQLDGGTDFTFGATYANVTNEAEGDGSDGFPVYRGDIETEKYLLPTIGIRHRINDKLVLGTGLQVVSGLGSDYRNSHPLGPTVTFLTFGANAVAAYELTPQTSIGASATIAYSMLEIGLNTGTAPQETFGVRGGLGITHDLGPVMVSANYSTEMKLDYHDITRDTLTTWEDLTLEQPQEFVVGIASTPAMWDDLLIEANVIYKNWDNAELYQDIWQDTTTFQLGAQYDLNHMVKLRAGYSYTTDLIKEGSLGTSVGNLTSLGVPGLGTVPISPALIQLIQSTLADPFWNHNITAGVGVQLTDTVSADFHLGYGFGEDKTQNIGANTIEAAIFQGGAGFSWKF